MLQVSAEPAESIIKKFRRNTCNCDSRKDQKGANFFMMYYFLCLFIFVFTPLRETVLRNISREVAKFKKQ